jgi:transcriptional regulator with XRE-family HTH domain
MLGWTQQHLAAAAVLSRRTIQSAEKGNPIAAESALGLCATLGVPYIEALHRDPEEVTQELLLRGYAPLAEPTPFVGREAIAAELREALKGPAGRVVIGGPAGIGKNSLARRLCRLLAADFPDGVAWVRAKALTSPTTRERAQRDLAEAFGFSDRLPLPDLVPRRAFDLAFVSRLWSRRRLLILDDVGQPEVVGLFQPDPEQGQVMITTRSRVVSDALSADARPLPPWPEHETRSYLQQRLGEERLAWDGAATARLVRATGGLPGHAAEAANVLSARPELEIAAYLAENPTWGDAVGLAAQTSPEAGALLRSLACVDRSPFSLEWACALTGTEPEEATHLLAELSERYLVHRIADWDGEEPSPRYHLDGRALALLEVEAADTKRLVATAVHMGHALRDVHPRLVLGRVLRDQPLWVRVADVMCEHVALPDDFDIEDPATLPRGQRYPGAEGLPELLWNLRGAFRFATTPALPGRLVAGAAISTEPKRFGQMAGLLSWQMMHVTRRIAAARWARAASEAFGEAGCWSQATRCAVFANHMVRHHVSPEEHLAACRQVEAECHVPDANAMAATALGLLPTDPCEAAEKLEEALHHLEGLDEKGHGQSEAAIDLVLQTARKLCGQEIDAPAMRHSALFLRSIARSSTLFTHRINDLVQVVAGVPAWRPLTPAQVLLTATPAAVRYRLNHLYDVAVALQGGAEGNARLVPTALGPMLAELLVDVPPFARDAGSLIEMPLPLEPMRSFLDEEGLAIALRFASAAGGQEHPAWRALSALSRAPGG